MDITALFGNSGGILGTESSSAVGAAGQDEKSRKKTNAASGDTVNISDEAKKLFSEKLHRYDRGEESAGTGAATAAPGKEAVTSDYTAEEGEEAEGQAAAGGGAGGAGSSSGSAADQVESLKKQIQSLKSQLMSMAGQVSGGAADAATTSKMDALQGQISALEAALAALQEEAA